MDSPEGDTQVTSPTSPVQPARKKQKGVIQDVEVTISAPSTEVVELPSSRGAESGREVPLVRAHPRLFRRPSGQATGALPRETEVELTRIGKTLAPMVGEERVLVDESLLAPLEAGMPQFSTPGSQDDYNQGMPFVLILTSYSFLYYSVLIPVILLGSLPDEGGSTEPGLADQKQGEETDEEIGNFLLLLLQHISAVCFLTGFCYSCLVRGELGF